MKQLNLFLELTRLKRPIGYMLLFWPCLWGLTIAYNFSMSIQFFMKYSLLFFLGAIFQCFGRLVYCPTYNTDKLFRRCVCIIFFPVAKYKIFLLFPDKVFSSIFHQFRNQVRLSVWSGEKIFLDHIDICLRRILSMYLLYRTYPSI